MLHMKILVTGNIEMGFKFHGPFRTYQQALKYFEKHFQEGTFYLTSLEKKKGKK